MTLTISPAHDALPAPALSGLRTLSPADAALLPALMHESYRGSVDDQGETLDDARGEVDRLVAGEFGHVDWAASCVVERGAHLASATIITRDRVAPPPLVPGEAFLAFSMTAPGWKRQGLARASLVAAIARLRERREPRLHLVVTRANVPAISLYRSLGFVDGPVGGVGLTTT